VLQALQTLTNFCVASTVFTEFRFKGPYVGTRLETGLGNALVLQIAAELRTHLEPLLRYPSTSDTLLLHLSHLEINYT
jgi:hypothetical protein